MTTKDATIDGIQAKIAELRVKDEAETKELLAQEQAAEAASEDEPQVPSYDAHKALADIKWLRAYKKRMEVTTKKAVAAVNTAQAAVDELDEALECADTHRMWRVIVHALEKRKYVREQARLYYVQVLQAIAHADALIDKVLDATVPADTE